MSLQARFIFGNGLVVDHIPSAALARGEIVHRGNGQLGIAHADIAASVMGGLVINFGVYELPKETGKAFSVGQDVYWDFDADKASPKGGIFFGKCVEAAATSGSVVRVTFCPEASKQIPESVRVDSSTVIAVGDLLYLATDDARPLDAFTWDTDLATTQAALAAVFLGVAMEGSADGETDPILCDVGGESIYEFACASGTYEVGATLGGDQIAGPLVSSDTLEAAASGAAIARAREYKASAATILKVSFASAYAPKNTNASIG